MVEVIIVRHTILVFEMYPTTDRLNLPLNLSSIQELVYICWEWNDQNKYYFDILRCLNIYLILLVILNLVLCVFYFNTLDVILMNDLVIILEIPCLHSIHVLVYSTDAIISPFFVLEYFYFITNSQKPY